jgi:hypothetical protein
MVKMRNFKLEYFNLNLNKSNFLKDQFIEIMRVIRRAA